MASGARTIANRALQYAWPDGDPHNCQSLNRNPSLVTIPNNAYRQAIQDWASKGPGNAFDEVTLRTDNYISRGASCDVFVGVVLRSVLDSGDVPCRGPGIIGDYMKKHPEKWQKVSYRSNTDVLQPGDIMVRSADGVYGHIQIYCGNTASGSPIIAQAQEKSATGYAGTRGNSMSGFTVYRYIGSVGYEYEFDYDGDYGENDWNPSAEAAGGAAVQSSGDASTATNYTLVILGEDGTQYDVSEFAEDLGWEENESELAMRLSFSIATDNKKLGAIIKIGCTAAVIANGKECARGIITTAKTKKSLDASTRTIVCYDDLYPMQTSEDQFYFPAGLTTKTILTRIFYEWNIPKGDYSGPDVEHEKLVFRSGTLAEIVLSVLEDARKKGGIRSIVRATQGKIDVVKIGTNTTVYLFDEEDTISVEQETSIAELVTRVKIVGKENATEGLPPVEAVLNGMTEFGIRQRIYSREADATAEEAQKAAQAILDEEGRFITSIAIKAPDVPEMRKGDLCFVHIGEILGYHYVSGIRHDATAGTMTLNIVEFPQTESAIDYLARLGVINSPDYWKQNYKETPYVDVLIEKAASIITQAGPRCATVQEGVNALVAAGVITTPAYWETKTGNVAHLLMALGGAVIASGAITT